MKIIKTIKKSVYNSRRLKSFVLLFILQSIVFVGFTQNLTLNIENKPLKEVLTIIESKANVVFFYNDKDVELTTLVKINVKNQPISKVLEELFKNTSNSFKIDSKQVYITKKKLSPPVINPAKVLNKITGIVIDTQGEALIGAAVVIDGSNKGVITDLEGKFELMNVPEKTELKISYINHESQTVKALDNKPLRVVLHESQKVLQEIVVVGYGLQKRESIVGAVTQAKGEELMRTGVKTNVGQTLSGLLPGVVTATVSGMPGDEDPVIRIRGLSSWNGSSPLVLIDGVERSMRDIDVGQIESISVLKDASATAVFGVKGGDGVILITTKRGKEGKALVSFSSNLTFKSVSRMPLKMDSYDTFAYQNEVLEKQNPANPNNWSWYLPQHELDKYRQPLAEDDLYYYPNVNWAEEILKKYAITQRYEVNITGGTNFAKYFAALSYLKDDDLLQSGLDVGLPYKPKWGFEHYNFRSNIDLNITKSTAFSVNLAGSIRTKSGFDNAVSHIWTAFYNLSPAAYPIRYPDGTFGYNINKPDDINPMLVLSGGSGLSTNYSTRLSSDFNLKQKLDFITKGLSVQASLSYDNGLYSTSTISSINLLSKSISSTGVVDYKPSSGGNDMDYFQVPGYITPESFTISATQRRLYYKGQIDYTRTFGEHDVAALVLMSREEIAAGSEFPHYREDWVGRVTYAYSNRYFIEANGAYNGSERFDKGYRFGFFPSIGIGWMLSEEQFLKNNWLEKLKIRYSVGTVGSDAYNAARWSYMPGWEQVGGMATFGTTFIAPSVGPGATYMQYRETAVGNPNLHWEVSRKQNLGMEFSVFKDILSGSVDLFRDDRSDVFMSASSRSNTIPNYFGMAPVAANIGKVLNQGFELDVKLQNTWSDFHAWTRFNYSFAKDKVIFAEDAELTPNYQKNAGFQIGQPKVILEQPGYTTSWDDLYGSVAYESNSQRLPGDVTMVDYNGDGIINDDDYIAYGFPNRPQNVYNVFLGIDYKGLSFMVQFLGAYNISQFFNSIYFMSNSKSPYASALLSDYWTPDNPNAAYPLDRSEVSSGGGLRTRGLLLDASYLRLKNIELGYTLSTSWLKKLRISTLKLTLSGNDLFLWSSIPDDREQTVDIWSQATLYPTLKRINIGLNLTF